MLPSAAVVSGAEKSTFVRNDKRLEHEKKRKYINFRIHLPLILPSVVVISGAGMKCPIVSNDKRNDRKIKRSKETSNTLTLILPSEGVISEAEIKRTVVINEKILQNEERTIFSNGAKIFVTFCSGYLWSWNKTHSCH